MAKAGSFWSIQRCCTAFIREPVNYDERGPPIKHIKEGYILAVYLDPQFKDTMPSIVQQDEVLI